MHSLSILLLSIALYVLAFSYPRIGVLSITSLALFIYVLRRTGTPFFTGWLYGTLIVGGSLLWGFGAIPLTKLGIEDPFASFVIVTMVWGLASVVLGVATGAASALYIHLLRQSLVVNTLLFASIWILSEILRSLLFSVLTVAPQSLIGPHWTFGYAGYMLADTAFVHLADIGGVYLLSGIVVALAYIAAHSWKHAVAVASIALLSLAPLPLANTNHLTASVGVLKTYEPSYSSTTNEASQERRVRLEDAVRNTLSTHPQLDILVLPEDSRLTSLSTLEQLAAITKHTIILDSSRLEGASGALSRITSYSPTLGKQTHYTKMLLVPEGEYLSFVYEKFFIKMGLSALVERFYSSKAYARGNALEPSWVSPYTIASSICSEIYSPFIMATLARDAQFIVNPTSHAGLHDPLLLTRQRIAMSKVRAVENNRYVLQPTNYGDAFVVSNHGEVVAHTTKGASYETLVIDVSLITTKTLFSHFPWGIPLVALLLLAYHVVRSRSLVQR